MRDSLLARFWSLFKVCPVPALIMARCLSPCVCVRSCCPMARQWGKGRRATLNYASPFHALCYVTLTDDTDRDGMVSSLPAPICDSAQRTLTIFLGPGNSCHKAPDSSLCTISGPESDLSARLFVMIMTSKSACAASK
jgi:hypothetical protein